MDLQSYFNRKNELYSILYELVKDDSDDDETYNLLINKIEMQQLGQNRDELKEFVLLLNKISKNHYRYKSLFPKIGKIISKLQESIKQTFSNYELFEEFKNNIPVLLYLFQNKIVDIDQDVKNFLSKDQHYCQFFSPEIKSNQEGEKEEDKENFERKRQIGENDSYICELIREDSVEKFIVYINERNIPFSSEIKVSFFETNPFLIYREKTTLIEYAAFFGSIQIFQYLRMNNVLLTPSLWPCAIHGRNAEIINILVDDKVDPPNDSYEKCLEEAIKCHHNVIANYIRDNFTKDISVVNDNEIVFNENIYAYSFHYRNYEYMPANLDFKYALFYLCAYGYTTLVKHFMKTKKFDVNERIVLNQFFFLNNVLKYSCFSSNSNIQIFFMEFKNVLFNEICIKQVLLCLQMS